MDTTYSTYTYPTQAMAIVLLLLVLLVQCFGHVNGEDELIRILKECDIYHGKWVYDDSYPLYNSTQCYHLNMHFDCQRNGRPDQQYLKYRWKPFACDLPRFSGKDLLERMRNKRITFIGDSISLNQWQSLTCMLHSHHPHAAFTQDNHHGFTQFTFLNHNVSVGFSWNPLLVEKESTSYGSVLNLGSISDFDANIWRHSDVLVFNSWLWWLHTDSDKPWDFIVDGDDVHKDMDRLVAYEKALSTWAHWVESNIDFDKTLVFFRGDSPRHPNASYWGKNDDGKQCSEEREPIEVREGNEYPLIKKPAGEGIVERILRKMSKPVRLLDITRLSMLRKDGHPAAYSSLHHQGMDCTHWCVPGVPDTWNHLFYIELLRTYL